MLSEAHLETVGPQGQALQAPDGGQEGPVEDGVAHLAFQARGLGKKSVQPPGLLGRPQSPAEHGHDAPRQGRGAVLHPWAWPGITAVPGDYAPRAPAGTGQGERGKAGQHKERHRRGAHVTKGRDGSQARQRSGGQGRRTQAFNHRVEEGRQHPGRDADEHADGGQHGHRNNHHGRRLPGPHGVGTARAAQESRAAHLDEAGHRQRADHGQDGSGDRGARHTGRQAREEPQVDQQLAHEAVQGRQAADRDSPNQEKRGRPGHGLCQAAQTVDGPGACRVDDRTRAQEKQGLEEAVVPDMEEAARHAQHKEFGTAARAAQHRQPHAHQDDADVLDAVVGQEPLDVVLRHREGHAEEARDGAQGQDHRAPGGGEAGQQGQCAQKAVYSHLQHHAGEHGRDLAGRGRVGAGQPEMKGHRARLQAKAEEGQEEKAVRAAPAQKPGEGFQIETSGGMAPQREQAEEGQRADMGGDDVDEARPSAFPTVVLNRYKEESRERHRLPSDQEGQGVPGDEQKGHPRHKQAEEKLQPPTRPPVARRGRITEAVNRGEGADEKNGHQEECAQGIECDEAVPHRRPRQGDRDRARPEQTRTGARKADATGED